MSFHLSLQQIEEAISHSDHQDQKRLLNDLPKLLRIQGSDLPLLKAAQQSFDFWNNPEDEIYDQL